MRIRPAARALALAALFPTLSIAAEERLPTIPPQAYTPEQRQAAEAFVPRLPWAVVGRVLPRVPDRVLGRRLRG